MKNSQVTFSRFITFFLFLKKKKKSSTNVMLVVGRLLWGFVCEICVYCNVRWGLELGEGWVEGV